MDLILFSGGLGNQMFQYALGVALKEKDRKVLFNGFIADYDCDHNGAEIQRLYNIKDKRSFMIDFFVRVVRHVGLNNGRFDSFIVSKILRLLGVNIIIDDVNTIKTESLPSKHLINIWYGRYQTISHFDFCQEVVLKALNLDDNTLSEQSKNMLQKIRTTESVSIHIRRGDYFKNNNEETFGNICTTNYYNNGIKLISQRISTPSFFIFSDDINWVKNNLEIPNAIFVDFNTSDQSWQDLYLMSQCKHNIIANSTFSWWSAFTNSNKEKIIVCPIKYTNNEQRGNFYPSGWLRAES